MHTKRIVVYKSLGFQTTSGSTAGGVQRRLKTDA